MKNGMSLLDLIQNNGGMTDPIGAIFRGMTAPKPQSADPRMAASGKTVMPSFYQDWLATQGRYGGVPQGQMPQIAAMPSPSPFAGDPGQMRSMPVPSAPAASAANLPTIGANVAAAEPGAETPEKRRRGGFQPMGLMQMMNGGGGFQPMGLAQMLSGNGGIQPMGLLQMLTGKFGGGNKNDKGGSGGLLD